MSESTPPPEAPKNKTRLQLSEVLTVDDLINFVLVKARSRRGRVVVTSVAGVLAAGVVLIPLTRSSSAAPSTQPPVTVVTSPPNTDDQTLRVTPLLPILVPKVGAARIGPKLPTTTVATSTTVTTAPATPTSVAQAQQRPGGNGGGGNNKPPVTQAPVLTVPPDDGGITVPSE